MLRLTRLVLALATLAALWPAQTLAQIKAGVVTNLEGSATAARSLAPQPVSLKFKDDVLQNDRIVTGDRSIVRLLLGGKAVVTVRERSSLTITEVPGKSTIDLDNGKIAVAVAKEQMRPGESFEVRTPNAVAAVRGTAFIIEVIRATAQVPGAPPVSGATTNIYGFGGLVPITYLSGQTFNVGTGNFAGGTGSQLANFGIMTQQQAQSAAAGVLTSPQTTAAGRENSNEQSMGTAIATFNQPGGLPQVAGGGGGGEPTPSSSASNSAPLLPGGQQSIVSASQPPASGLASVFQTNYGSLLSTLSCDDCSTNVNFGFSFPFRGRNYTSGEISSNGFVLLGGASGSTSFTPTVSDFVNGLARIAVAWADHDLRVGNGLKFNTSPGQAIFTWDAVGEFNQRLANNTFQLQLRSDGRIVFGYQRLSLTQSFGGVPHNVLVGVTGGGGAADPGSTDFASQVPFSTSGGTVYHFFVPATTFNLTGAALIFIPNASGGWDVSDPEVLAFVDDLMQNGSGPLFDLKSTSLTSNGPLFRSLNEQYDTATTFFNLDSTTITGLGTDPLLWFGGTRVTTSGNFLRATNSTMTTAGTFARLESGAEIVQTSSGEALMWMRGGSLATGTGGTGNLFDLLGRPGNTQVDGDTGLTLGTDRPLQPGSESPVFEASNATVTVRGSAYRVDTALLEATAPLLNLTNGSNLTTSGHAVDLVGRAKVALPNDAVAMVNLNSSLMTVTTGHLVNVAGGSYLNLAGNLVNLSNGSTLNILNGLLLNVSGGSVANIGRSLVSFNGSGNVLNVTNNLVPTALIGGVPVSGPADSFRISGNALAGLGTAGTIRINGVVLTPTTPLSSIRGSLVAVQGSGTVRVGP